MAKPKRKKCLHDDRVAYSRGLCWSCFNKHSALVLAGVITEEDAVKRGLILPVQRGGPKPRNKSKGYEAALAKARR